MCILEGGGEGEKERGRIGGCVRRKNDEGGGGRREREKDWGR